MAKNKEKKGKSPEPEQQTGEPVVWQKRLGHLQLCVDKRYLFPLYKEWEALTGLQRGEYWAQANAGGAPKMNHPNQDVKDVLDASPRWAYANGAKIFGWGGHGNWCGGYGGEDGGVTDDEIKKDLMKTLEQRRIDFPNAKHYALFITGTPPNFVFEWIGPKKGVF